MNCPSCQAENADAAEVCFSCRAVLSAITRGSLIASRYEILTTLGKGGMGTVYKAQDRVLDEPVAIKLLRSEVASDAEMTRRFRSEIKLARKVSHRNVCRIHEYGEDQGLRYISMEFIDGVDLKQVLRQRGSLPPQEAFDISVQLALGLEAIHDVGIIHRDLKTPNIMRDSRGVVRLMDFGIAKLSGADATSGGTATGQVMGTPEYMSPEQARGQKVDFRTDIYALGVVVYEIFTGQVPFKGDTPVATLFMHVQEPPPLSGLKAARIPAPLRAVLGKALEKHPSDRYASVKEMAEALRQAWTASGVELLASPTPTGLPVLTIPEDAGDAFGSAAASTAARGSAPTVGLAASPTRLERAAAPAQRPAAPQGGSSRPAPGVRQRAGGPTPEWGLDRTRKGLLLGAIALAVGAGVSLSLWDQLFPAPAEIPAARPPLTQASTRSATPPPFASASPASELPSAESAAVDLGSRRTAVSPPPVAAVPAPAPRATATPRASASPRPTPILAVVPATTAPTLPPTPIPTPTPLPTPTPPATTLAAPPATAPPAPAAIAPTTLAPAAVERGVLQLVVVPFADVTVDDAPMGKVSSSKIPLAAGSHVVLLNHPDYQPLRRKISIVPGETLKLVVDLAEEAVRKKK